MHIEAAAAVALALQSLALILGTAANPILQNAASLDGFAFLKNPSFSDGPVFLDDPINSHDDLVATLDRLRKALRVPGMSVSVIHKSKVVLSRGFGVRNVRNDPVTADTRFRIASMTKAFTSFGVATLVSEGLLEWKQPVREYRNVRFADSVVTDHATLLDIMSHRTGLPRHDGISNFIRSGTKVLDVLKYLPLSRDFREQFQYNNLMFLLAGSIAANTSIHDDWQALTQSRIFDRLNMTSSTTDYLHPIHSTDFAEGFEIGVEGDTPRTISQELQQLSVTVDAPAGIISSTASDMIRWMRLMLAKGTTEDGTRLLKEEDFDMLVTPRMLTGDRLLFPEHDTDESYGLGWVINYYRGHRQYSHGGNLNGYSSHICLFPEADMGVTILTNAGVTSAPMAACRIVADALLFPGQPSLPWVQKFLEIDKKRRETPVDNTPRVPDTHPSKPLDLYVGTYVHPGYGSIIVRRAEAAAESTGVSLNVCLGHRSARIAEHWHYDTFKVAEEQGEDAMMLVFELSVAGNVVAFRALGLEPAITEGIRFVMA
ncbi:hypothetical protein HDU88_007862 [Geranomyces variabilis]|nr:hypothetical protein HDU88_007862 [Geranomyces variabilis]